MTATAINVEEIGSAIELAEFFIKKGMAKKVPYSSWNALGMTRTVYSENCVHDPVSYRLASREARTVNLGAFRDYITELGMIRKVTITEDGDALHEDFEVKAEFLADFMKAMEQL